MSRKKELRKLSRNQLIEIIFNLEERIKKLESYLKAFENAHTPSSKQLKKNTKNEEDKDSNDKSSDDKKGPRFPGKPKGSKGGGIKLPAPDKVVEHTLDISPISGLPLGKPISYRSVRVIDMPDKPIQTIEHRIMQYKDPLTGEIVEASVNLPKGIYGKNLKSFVVLLKESVNSHYSIAEIIRVLGAPSFSHSTVTNILTEFTKKLEPIQKKILSEIKKEPFLHADETGFRVDGINRYVWGIFSNTKAIFLAGVTRASKHFKKLIRGFSGILVNDGYNGYRYYPLKQRCWAHLIREFKEIAREDKEVMVQYRRIKALYDRLKELKKKPPDDEEIAKVKGILNDIVNVLSSTKKGKKLATLIKNGGDDWFTALYYPEVPLDNNLAERGLRRIVLFRKMAGAIRNWKGKRWIEVGMSVIQTWRLQGLNVFQQLRRV